MSIVTRTGDRGETGLFGSGRTSKASARLQAVGTVDELNAILGMLQADHPLPETLHVKIRRMQNILFVVGADLATPISSMGSGSSDPRPQARIPAPTDKSSYKSKRITENHVATIERWIEEMEETLPALQSFILPGGSSAGALLHLARTVCRRAERWVVALKEQEPINPQVLIFLNRLGDYLFLAARIMNRLKGIDEERVRYE